MGRAPARIKIIQIACFQKIPQNQKRRNNTKPKIKRRKAVLALGRHIRTINSFARRYDPKIGL